MKSPILGSSYVARSINAADNRMVNLFPEIVPEGGKEAAFLNRAPGLKRLATLGTGPVRGMWVVGAYAYVVSGNQFYRVDFNWNSVYIGPITGTGPVSMTDNGGVIFIACGGPSFTYNIGLEQLNSITDVNFPGAVTVGFLNGWFVFFPPNDQKIYVVDSVSPTGYIYPLVFDPTLVASAEGNPDNIVSLIIDHSEIWLFGTQSVEVWYDAGIAGFPFSRIQGAFNEIGCAATYSVAKLDNSLFWLGKDARGQGIVYRSNGYSGVRVSTHAIEYAIAQYTDIQDAFAYTYQQEGHSFYVLIFPTANATWVYDVATQAWHERAGFSAGQFTRHPSNCQMAFSNKIVVGDYQDGRIYAFDLDKYSDDDRIQKWLRSWRALPTGQNNLNRTAHHSLQLDAQTGAYLDPITEDVFLVTEEYAKLMTESGDFLIDENQTSYNPEPNVMLRWSDDGGHTWSNEHWKYMGAVGQYYYRTLWRRLGMTVKLRDRVYEVSGTDPIKIAIMGAELHMTPTNA
jgi:hypothetical protein